MSKRQLVLGALALSNFLGSATGTAAFVRGDADQGGSLTVTDAVVILRSQFKEPFPTLDLCADAFDADDSGTLEVTDGLFLLTYLFRRGDILPPPFPSCGEDPSADELSCELVDPCGSDSGATPASD